MPPRKLKPTFADAYSAVANDLRVRLGDAQAAQAGPPASLEAVPANDVARVQAWTTPHPEATDQAMQQLAQQQFQQHRATGRSPEDAAAMTAEDLTHFRYRARLPLYTLGTTSAQEQVAEAGRLARLVERHRAEASSAPAGQGGATRGD